VFILIRKKKWLWAGLLSALAALTRVQGIILVVPIFIELVMDYFKDKNLKQLIIQSFSCVYAPFAYGLYSIYMFFGLRVDWPWNMLATHWDQHLGLPWEGFIGIINTFFITDEIIIFYPPIMKIVNILLPLLTIFILLQLRKKIPKSISVYSWVMLLLILGKIDQNNALVSTIRYLLALFPIYWGLVLILKNKIEKLVFFTISVVIQIIQLVYFYWWIWVA
jgi:hypothetical protein